MENNNIKFTNLGYLLRLSKGDHKFVEDMIAVFLKENSEEIQTLKKGVQEHNFEIMKSSIHKLRSIVAFVGIDKMLENDMSEIELLAAAHMGLIKTDYTGSSDDKKIELMFAHIKEVCEEARKELTQEKRIKY